ncbi:MAG: hypothetical protein H0U59_09380 [Gemmatimonadaceae bacterium]|nr:hypothetical protein [Gemmatimonadaceae bacterium]
MADAAYATMYRSEWIKGFERDQALLRSTVTTEAIFNGREAVFLVATTNREAVTRGPNGLIPASTDDLNQYTLTIEEKHDLPQKTRFNIFVGQSDQRAIMQANSRGVINRDVDNEIIDALETGTLQVSAVADTMGKGLVNKAITMMVNANIPFDGRITGVLTPAAWAYLSDIPQFASQDYVRGRPMEEGPVTRMRWMGIDWTMHSGLPGIGTASASCFIYHKSAVGHAYASGDIQALSGYNEEQDYSWTRTTLYHGAKLLQNTGVIEILHDDSALSA